MAKLFVNINGQLAEIGKGKSAYEIAVDEGYSGTQEEWLESLKGSGGIKLAYDDGTVIENAEVIVRQIEN